MRRQTMKALVSRWGNSLAIRLPKAAVESLRVQEGEAVELRIEGDRIEIRAVHPRYRLQDLLTQITPGTQPETVEFAPAGEEAL
jgi:antitoxin component of MazEF toxin-antitoxin module